MGPMGNYMTLLQLARGRGGGYGGPQGYGGGMGGYGMPRGPMGYGPYGAPPQQGSFMRPIEPEGMMGAAGANMQAMQGNDYSRQMADQLGANAAQFGAPTDITPMIQSNAQAGSGPATPAEQAAYENSPALAAARNWASGFGQQVMPGVYGAGAMQGPPQQQGNPYMNTAYNPMGLRGRRRFY